LTKSLSSLRTEIAAERGLTRREIAVIVVVLLVVFCLIWLIMRNVLLFEIDAEMQKQTLPTAKSRRGRFAFPFYR
jgi:hypothetical protein